MAAHHISMVEQFKFSNTGEWSQQIRRFWHFWEALSIAAKSEESQVNTLQCDRKQTILIYITIFSY